MLSLGRVVLYSMFMVFRLPQALVKTLAKNLVKNLAKNLVENLANKMQKRCFEGMDLFKNIETYYG